jgi:glycopeptide antibiotics resistance protein
MTRSTTAPLLVLYVSYLLLATFHPFVVTGTSAESATRFLAQFFTVKGPVTKDFLQNVALFIPFGVLFYLSLKPLHRSGTARIFFTLVAGGALSFSIELGQIFFARRPEISDVIANSLGAVCGAWLAALCPGWMAGVIARSWNRFVTSRAFVFILLMFGAVPLVLSIIQSPWPNFRTWNSNLPFQIANEATLNRPWLGRIYLVAVFNRALSLAEIGNNFRSGFSGTATEKRAKNGLVALYTFAEGGGEVVHDVSGFGGPLNLVLAPPSHVNWLKSSNGIEVARPAIIKSEGQANKLANAFRDRDEISVEVWFTPANLTQGGPARLVSFSKDLRDRNFTVGQQGAEFVFRLRTLIAGRSGSADALATDDQILKLQPSHVVATYAGGVKRIYINGVQHPKTLDMTKDIVIGFATRKTPMAQIAYSFFYFFPVALFLAIFFTGRSYGLTCSLLASVVVAIGLQFTTEIVQSLLFNRAIDFSLVGYGLIVATVGSLAGAGLPKGQPTANQISCYSDC